MKMDRLSALPEPLLLSILYNLGLKKAAQTSVLSKQWRFLWAKCSFSYFYETSKETEQIRRFVARVTALIAHGRSPPLNRLNFSFNYDSRFAADVDLWLDFAAKNRVKGLLLELQLDFSTDYYRRAPLPYTLPQIIYSIASLTWLHLNKCTMIPTAAVDWRCLERLSLHSVNLSQQAIDKIVSGCPVLKTLDLESCDGINRLEIGGRRFRSLRVTVTSNLQEISAPYMTNLRITVSLFTNRIEARLRNVQSLQHATICLCIGDSDDDISVDGAKRYAMELFQDLRHVEHLSLSYRSTEVLAMMRNEWRLPQCWAKNLSMVATSVRDIYGALAVLESCPYIENLFITIQRDRKKNSINWGPLIEDDFNCDLLHLKIVKFQYYSGSNLRSEAILTLQQILLKRAPLLEKMVINYKKLPKKDVDFIKEMLLNYPKSSQKVSVDIRH